jgi:hypothetical protein
MQTIDEFIADPAIKRRLEQEIVDLNNGIKKIHFSLKDLSTTQAEILKYKIPSNYTSVLDDYLELILRLSDHLKKILNANKVEEIHDEASKKSV